MRLSCRLGFGLGALLSVAACANPEESIFSPGGRVNSAAVGQIVGAETEPFSADRLAAMIEAATPGRVVETETQAAERMRTETSMNADQRAQTRLDRALARFSRALYASDVDGQSTSPNVAEGEVQRRAVRQNQMRDARNNIQSQLLAASVNRCNVYKTHLRQLASRTQFGLGSAATLAGAAGALVTGGASQSLAAAAGAFSGINAEFQRDYLGSLVTSIIIPGIDRQRADLRNDIVSKSCNSVSDYPVALAMAEAVRFHGACSADVGIAASGQAVARTASNSIPEAINAIQLARQFATLAQTPSRAQVDAAKATADKLKKDEEDARKAANGLTDAEAKKDAIAKADLLKRAADNAAIRATQVKASFDAAAAGTFAANLPGGYDDNRPTNLMGSNLVIKPCNPLDQYGKEIAPATR